MKKLITPILILCCSSVLVAQTTTEEDYFSKPKTSVKDKISTSVVAGAGVSFLNASNNTVYTTFIAPKIGYQLSPKFKLNVGLLHYSISGNTFMQLSPNESFLNTNNKPLSGNLFFVGGDYLLNPRLTMSGAVMMDANNMSTKQNNFKAAAFGLNYKVSEHSSIGFKAYISQGNDNYNYNYNHNSGTGRYGYSPNSLNAAESLFLSPLTQWGMGNNVIPAIR